MDILQIKRKRILIEGQFPITANYVFERETDTIYHVDGSISPSITQILYGEEKHSLYRLTPTDNWRNLK